MKFGRNKVDSYILKNEFCDISSSHCTVVLYDESQKFDPLLTTVIVAVVYILFLC
jgi:hypothetical protein